MERRPEKTIPPIRPPPNRPNDLPKEFREANRQKESNRFNSEKNHRNVELKQIEGKFIYIIDT